MADTTTGLAYMRFCKDNTAIHRSERIVIRLRHAQVDDNEDDMVKYHALSYVWGSKFDPNIVTCNGYDLDITSNLHDALQQLREDGIDGLIWVDAVCINQNNLDERARQVRLMRKIYSHAEMVYVWLGKESPNAAAGIELLHRTAQAVRGRY